MERAKLTLQIEATIKPHDPSIIFEDAGKRLLRKLMKQYGTLKMNTLQKSADSIAATGKPLEFSQAIGEFARNKELQDKYNPLSSAMRTSAVSAGTRMAYAIYEKYADREWHRIAHHIRQRAFDPTKNFYNDRKQLVYRSVYKNWYESFALAVDSSCIRDMGDGRYLKLPNLTAFLFDIKPFTDIDYTKLSNVSVYLLHGEFRIRFKFGRGSRGGRV